MPSISLSAISHPDFLIDLSRWYEYRLTFEGGDQFMDEYLIRQPDETDDEWRRRKRNTPIPAVAKDAIQDLQRAISQRLADITRTGGTARYDAAVNGEGGGIDREGQSMNMFMAHDVLIELLIMGRVGIYVDNTPVPNSTLIQQNPTPYAYVYRVEDILNWETMRPEQEGKFKMVLLRDHEITFNQAFGISFPNKHSTRLRLVWIGDDGFVRYRFLTEKLEQILDIEISPQFHVEDDGAIVTPLREIPFTMPQLSGGSLLRDVASYQRALLNVASNEAMLAININSPILAIQKDIRSDSLYWKKPGGDNAEPGSQRGRIAREKQGIRAGWTRARYYDTEENIPAWVTIPVESLKASHEYRQRAADEVRQSINVAVQNQTGVRSESREQKEISAEGLEAGLYFIATKLQQSDQQIAKFFAMYENSDQVATVSYPKRFRLKKQSERIKDAQEFKKLIDGIPGQINKKEGYKRLIVDIFTGLVDSTTLNKMLRAVDNQPYIGDPDKILELITNALITRERAAGSFDLPSEEVKKAMEQRIEMATKITLASQTSDRPAARGVPESDTNPQSGEEERAEDAQKRGEQKAPVQEKQ